MDCIKDTIQEPHKRERERLLRFPSTRVLLCEECEKPYHPSYETNEVDSLHNAMVRFENVVISPISWMTLNSMQDDVKKIFVIKPKQYLYTNSRKYSARNWDE